MENQTDRLKNRRDKLMKGLTEGWIDRWTGGLTDQQTDIWMDRKINRGTDTDE